jgi:hypothetical protein
MNLTVIAHLPSAVAQRLALVPYSATVRPSACGGIYGQYEEGATETAQSQRFLPSWREMNGF